ncbi:ABC transporter permease [Tyzzerella sp. OttesenSCG-928-J15]|nr:ABC transporter permease [Tyzzerella sp. OttesenSCG-928-J15]
MGRYIAKRLLEMIPLMLIISFVVFMFIHMLPGDPARTLAGVEATPEEIEAIRENFGLNDPLIVQYFNYMKGLFNGDLGTSLKSNLPVTELIWSRFQYTIQLVIAGILWAPVVGIAIGIICAIKRGTLVDLLGMLFAICGLSAPGFWLGLIGIQFFSVKHMLLPVGGLDSWKSFILPSIVMGTGIMATLARYSRSSMLETLREDYVRTARAKGQKEAVVMFRHAFKNSLIQVVTILGLQIGGLLSGSVITETIFSIPGMGRLLVDSIAYRDYPTIQGLLMIFALQYVIINLIVDVLYGAINPKIRYD